MTVMEKSEPSFIPGWLKGASGGGIAAPHLLQPGLYQDDGGSSILPRQRASQQQLPAVGSGHVDYDSPRSSASSDRLLFPSSRRGPSSNSTSIERLGADRENFSQGRSYSGFTRSSSIRSHDALEREREGYRGDGGRNDRDWDWEGDRDLWSRERERVLGFGAEEREERERLENGMLRLSVIGTSGKYDSDASFRRSQSMTLSPRIPDNGMRKMNEGVNLPSPMASASGALATSIQKAVFERNFPSLGADEKLGGMPGGGASIASPRPLWQGSSRPDLGRASSPGLTGGFSSSIATTSSPATGGGVADYWSSALAEAPSSNGSMQNGPALHVAPVSTVGGMSSGLSGPGSTPSSNALNMAEALTQNPPRVRTPPQLAIDSQRLEELALKQSRQLIPMIPTLPKTMSLADKTKPKPLRSIDGIVTSSSKGSQPSSSLQINSPHRSLAPTRPDTPKASQGKLLVLKPSKDGSTTVSSSLKLEGGNASSHGNLNLTASAMSIAGASVPASGIIGQRKQPSDRRAALLPGTAGPDALAGLRARESACVAEDKRPSLQAQNRSDFFNALRKKAAGNGSVPFNTNKSDSSLQPKSDVMILSEAEMREERVVSVNHSSAPKPKLDSVGQKSESIPNLSEILSNGDMESNPGNGSILDEVVSLGKESCAVDSSDGTNVCVSLPGDSEEEEAAFMRSLGWEENAEGSELTEEEINAFYQMREKKKLLNSRSHYTFRNQCAVPVGSLRSASSGLSSDSESDDELHV